MDKSKGFVLEDHQESGDILKSVIHDLNSLKHSLKASYPRSGDKIYKQIEAAIDKLKSVQTNLHGRLMDEFSEMSDDELLPVYLGRYESN